MKKALIAGFFDMVEDDVRKDYGAAVDRGEIVVVRGRSDPRHGMVLDHFKQGLATATQGGCTELLVVLGLSADWVEDKVLAILAPLEARLKIQLEVTKDLRSSEPVIGYIVAFGLVAAPVDSDSERLKEQLAGKRVLCVRASTQPGFGRTLERHGFVFDELVFTEESIEPAKNSNLIQSLSNRAEQYDWLLYSWAGLRYLPPDVKRKFKCGALSADSPSKVVVMLKRSLLKDTSS